MCLVGLLLDFFQILLHGLDHRLLRAQSKTNECKGAQSPRQELEMLRQEPLKV